MSDLDRKLAAARAPYANKIMALEAEKDVLMRQVEERNTELAIVRSQRDGLRRAMAVIEQAAHAASNL